jgi:SnoaL-like protein
MFRGYVQLVHEAVRCFQRQDWEELQAMIAPDAIMTPIENWPDPGPFAGPEVSIREYKRLRELFRGIEITVGDVVSYEKWVVARYRGVSDPSATDEPVEMEFTGVHRFEGNLFAESHYRFDRDAALAAAGL